MRTALGVAALLVVAACALAVAQAPAASDAARRSQVLASFDGWQLSVGGLEDVIALKPAFVRTQLVAVEARRELVREVIDYELLLHEAERRGYADNDRVLDAIAQRMVELLHEQEAARFEPDALPLAEVQAYYAANRATFMTPPMRRAAYRWLATRDQAQHARGPFAQMPLDEVRRNAAAAAADGTGGELGWVDAEGGQGNDIEVPPEQAQLAKLAFSLSEVGAVLPAPVQVGDRWLVLRLTGIKPGHGDKLAEVEAEVRDQLAESRYEQAIDALVARLRKEHGLVVKPELSDLIRLEPGTPLDMPAGFPAAPPDPTAPPVMVEPDGA